MTRRNFFFPKFFSCFSESGYCFGFFFAFHTLSPHCDLAKFNYTTAYLSNIGGRYEKHQ
jgi:hypothetical protein